MEISKPEVAKVNREYEEAEALYQRGLERRVPQLADGHGTGGGNHAAPHSTLAAFESHAQIRLSSATSTIASSRLRKKPSQTPNHSAAKLTN